MSEQPTPNPSSHLESRLGPISEDAEQHRTPEVKAVGADLMDASIERSRAFLDKNTELINGLKQGEQQLLSVIQSGQDLLNHFKYGNVSKEQTVAQLRDVTQHVRVLSDHQGDALDGYLRQEANRFLEDASETTGDASRLAQEAELDDQVRLVVRHTEGVAEEIRGSVRVMDHARDDRTQALRTMSRLIDELEHDQWGAEATAAQIGKALSDLEDSTGYQFRGLGRIEAELETLQRLTKPV